MKRAFILFLTTIILMTAVSGTAFAASDDFYIANRSIISDFTEEIHTAGWMYDSKGNNKQPVDLVITPQSSSRTEKIGGGYKYKIVYTINGVVEDPNKKMYYGDYSDYVINALTGDTISLGAVDDIWELRKESNYQLDDEYYFLYVNASRRLRWEDPDAKGMRSFVCTSTVTIDAPENYPELVVGFFGHNASGFWSLENAISQPDSHVVRIVNIGEGSLFSIKPDYYLVLIAWAIIFLYSVPYLTGAKHRKFKIKYVKGKPQPLFYEEDKAVLNAKTPEEISKATYSLYCASVVNYWPISRIGDFCAYQGAPSIPDSDAESLNIHNFNDRVNENATWLKNAQKWNDYHGAGNGGTAETELRSNQNEILRLHRTPKEHLWLDFIVYIIGLVLIPLGTVPQFNKAFTFYYLFLLVYSLIRLKHPKMGKITALVWFGLGALLVLEFLEWAFFPNIGTAASYLLSYALAPLGCWFFLLQCLYDRSHGVQKKYRAMDEMIQKRREALRTQLDGYISAVHDEYDGFEVKVTYEEDVITTIFRTFRIDYYGMIQEILDPQQKSARRKYGDQLTVHEQNRANASRQIKSSDSGSAQDNSSSASLHTLEDLPGTMFDGSGNKWVYLRGFSNVKVYRNSSTDEQIEIHWVNSSAGDYIYKTDAGDFHA